MQAHVLDPVRLTEHAADRVQLVHQRVEEHVLIDGPLQRGGRLAERGRDAGVAVFPELSQQAGGRWLAGQQRVVPDVAGDR